MHPFSAANKSVWILSTLFAISAAFNAYPESDDQDEPLVEEATVISPASIVEYLQRLAAARSGLYDSYYEPSPMVSDMLRDRRRGSMAENNFQLRVRKRGVEFAKPLSAESNFQLRVRKDFLDRLRESPHIRSSAEENFQLRVRRKPSMAERNFQLRVRRADPDVLDAYQRSVRRSLLERMRDRRFGQSDDNFQLRVRRSPEATATSEN